MNLPSSFRLLAALLFLTASTQAQDNRYDLLGRMLMPIVNVFAKNTSNPNRALSCTLKLEQMTDLPAALVGSQAELAVEYPDKMRLRAPILGEDITVCRHGEELWTYPGSKVEAVLKAAAEQKKLPKLNSKFRLEPFSLPIPEKELVFLPTLFQAKDVGSEPLDGVTCRVIDIYLMPELARALKAQGWGARVWIQPDAKPARISVAKPGWMAVVHFDQLQFAPKLPESTWEPTSEQAADVLKLDPARFQQLLGAIVK
ncbi:MAG TPA: hypothetical protein VGM54_21900 [Chthoniobacter sp.]|jgi:hypothetical protein